MSVRNKTHKSWWSYHEVYTRMFDGKHTVIFPQGDAHSIVELKFCRMCHLITLLCYSSICRYRLLENEKHWLTLHHLCVFRYDDVAPVVAQVDMFSHLRRERNISSEGSITLDVLCVVFCLIFSPFSNPKKAQPPLSAIVKEGHSFLGCHLCLTGNMVTCFSIAHGAALTNGKTTPLFSCHSSCCVWPIRALIFKCTSRIPPFPVKTVSLVGKGVVTVFLPRVTDLCMEAILHSSLFFHTTRSSCCLILLHALCLRFPSSFPASLWEAGSSVLHAYVSEVPHSVPDY